MSYTFGDLSTGATDSTGGGLDIGYYPTQDISVDDVYFGSENTTTGWESALDKVYGAFSDVLGTGGDIFNSYVDKLLDREVYGSNWYGGDNAADTVRPVNTVDPAAQTGGGIDTKTLIIGGVVLAAFALIALKK